MTERWVVSAPDILKRFCGGDISIGPDDWFEFSVVGGYMTIRHGRLGEPALYEFRGAYHPDGICRGTGVCDYCGMTLFDDAEPDEAPEQMTLF